jgi:hypothetical protein
LKFFNKSTTFQIFPPFSKDELALRKGWGGHNFHSQGFLMKALSMPKETTKGKESFDCYSRKY